MIRESAEVGTKVFSFDYGFGEILEKNESGSLKVHFAGFTIDGIKRRELNEVEGREL